MNRRVRVLVVTNMWPGERSAHIGVFVQRQVEALRAARTDWDFDVFTIRGARGRRDYFTAVPRLRRRLAHGYDIVHAHYGLTGMTAALAGARPLVLTLHGGEIEVAWQKPLTRLVMRRSAAVVAVSEWVRGAFGDPSMRVVSCGVPTDVFTPHDRSEARRRLGLPAEAPVVLFPADPREPVKDHALFRSAMSQVARERPTVVELTLGVAPAEVPWFMAAADVVVLTSKEESGPLVVKEALACGTRVVSVDVGDARATLEGVPGCSVTRHDAGDIARATLRALSDPEGQGEAQARRRRIFDLGLDDPAIAQRLIAVYEDVLSTSDRRTE